MLKKISFALTVCVATLMPLSLATARPATSMEKNQLVQLVRDFDGASERKDISLMVNTMPQRLLDEMAKQMGTTPQNLRSQMYTSLKDQFSDLPSGGYQLDAENIEYKETSDGHFYALVPTTVQTESAITKFMTLAIYDNTKWHFIFGGQKTVQNSIFAKIYPYASEIKMPVADITDTFSNTYE